MKRAMWSRWAEPALTRLSPREVESLNLVAIASGWAHKAREKQSRLETENVGVHCVDSATESVSKRTGSSAVAAGSIRPMEKCIPFPAFAGAITPIRSFTDRGIW